MMITGGTISRAGTSAFALMILWISLKLTGVPLIAGLADGFFSAPLFLSFIVGTMIDRTTHKKVIAVVSALCKAFAIMLLYLAVLLNFFYSTVFLIFLCVLTLGFATDVNNAVRSSWTKTFLSESDYKKGSAQINILESIAQLTGYAISGVFLYIGLVRGIYALVLIFLLAALPILLIKTRLQETTAPEKKDGLMEGIAFLKGTRILQQIIFIGMLANIAIAMLGIGFTVLIQKDLKLPALYFSIIFIAISLGIIAGSVLSSRVKGKLGNIVFMSLLLISLSLFSLTLVHSVYLMYAPVFLAGFGVGLVNTPAQTALLREIPENMIARSMGLFNMLALSGTFLSGTIGALVIELSSVRVLFALMGVMMGIGALSALVFKEMRKSLIL
ncbi:MAG: MFS transporter [Candidatus Thermoplasmatota archaeon]|nr:MFS transporter [Candidatus Thermoplasmatota archaeon]